MKKFFLLALIWSMGYFFKVHETVAQNQKQRSPNIILILTDDQGIGDIGYLGNPYIKTPHLDQLASRSTRFSNFYVSPVCAPTRASIMTGKYSEKTGIYDTYNGGAIMASRETTIAEILSENGYRTGIIGKWHLGDNYPFRPMEQGFSESLIFKSGGMGQPGDVKNFFAGDSSYFDPVLWKNGTPVQTDGYCSDVFMDAAIDFIKAKKKDPFFLYLAFNAPHRPLQVPQRYYDMYKDMGFTNYQFDHEGTGIAHMNYRNLDDARKVYGMVTNIDDNIGRLEQILQQENLEDNTIVIFLSDNGPAENRFRLGLRGKKTEVYQGGVKVPFFMYSPEKLPVDKEIPQLAAHIDLLPTILDLCNLHSKIPDQIDGRSLVPLIEGQNVQQDYENRTLYSEWGRGYPVPYQNFSVRQGDYKLIGNTGYDRGLDKFELYNIRKDYAETTNIIDSNRQIAANLKKKMEQWYQSIVHASVNNEVRRIQVGTSHENPVILNRNDASGQPGIWTQDENFGYWNIQVTTAGRYNVRFRFIHPIEQKGTMRLKLYPYQYALSNAETGVSTLIMNNISLHKGDYRLESYYQSPTYRNLMPLYVELEKVSEN